VKFTVKLVARFFDGYALFLNFMWICMENWCDVY